MENAVRLSSADADAVGDEVELVRRAAFEASAFAELYQRYLARVYRYLRVRSVNNEEAADLTQQVFLKASEALPRYRQRGAPFSAWLFRIARNAATDTRRHRRDAVSLDSIVENMAPDDVEAAVLDREAHLRLRVLLKELPGDERELLALRFAGGLSSREIASVVEASEAAVKKRLTRTIQKLKERYGG